MPTSRPQVAFLAAAGVAHLGDARAQCTRCAHAFRDDVPDGRNDERRSECRVPRALHHMGPDRARCRVRARVASGSYNSLVRNRITRGKGGTE
jgi:hypothetical protein